MKKTTIYMVRHCESEGNACRRSQALFDGIVTRKGLEQAQVLAQRFAEVPVTAIYSSDAYRSRVTAEPLAKLKGLPVQYRLMLREYTIGAWEGLGIGHTACRYPELYATWLDAPYAHEIPGADPFALIAERGYLGIQRIAAENPGGTVVAVTHSCTLTCALTKILGQPISYYKSIKSGDNTAVTKLEVDENGNIEAVYINDDSHLPDHLLRKNYTGRSAATNFDFHGVEEDCVCLGNHDVRSGKQYTKQELNMDVFYRIFGDAYRTYETATTDLQEGCIHHVVGGYHFLAINPLDTGYLCSVGDDSGAKYSEKAKLWLDKRLSEITAQVPEHYVFITTHPMIYGLAYGSELVYNNLYWYTKELVPILNKYPQVVAFGGHLHFPISNERTIMQDKITSINCGAMSYMAIENGNYRNMISGTVMADAWEVSNGHLVQVDEQGNVRIIRMNFALETTIKEPWVLPAPTSDGAHLQRYTKARGDAAHNLPPVLAEDAISVTDDGADPLAVTLTFLSGSDDDEIHYYEAIITENGEEVEKIRLLADSYLRANPQDMKTSWTVALKENTYQKGHTYTVTLNAYDCWDGKSNDVVYTYTPK